MSRGALLTGTAGGIIGAITAAIGVIWFFILGTFSTEINDYLSRLGLYLTSVLETYRWGGTVFSYPFFPLPYFPSASLFGVSSFILAIFLIVTGVLVGVGFYGTYKISGRGASVIGVISSVIGITAGALLIIIGNTTTGYGQTHIAVGQGEAAGSFPLSIVAPIPNFPLIEVGFIILGVTFIVLGSASISVREITEKPSVFHAAGILSIIAAVFFLLGYLIGIIATNISVGIGLGAIIGFGLILVAFILWAVVFYSSREL